MIYSQARSNNKFSAPRNSNASEYNKNRNFENTSKCIKKDQNTSEYIRMNRNI